MSARPAPSRTAAGGSLPRSPVSSRRRSSRNPRSRLIPWSPSPMAASRSVRRSRAAAMRAPLRVSQRTRRSSVTATRLARLADPASPAAASRSPARRRRPRIPGPARPRRRPRRRPARLPRQAGRRSPRSAPGRRPRRSSSAISRARAALPRSKSTTTPSPSDAWRAARSASRIPGLLVPRLPDTVPPAVTTGTAGAAWATMDRRARRSSRLWPTSARAIMRLTPLQRRGGGSVARPRPPP